MNRLAHAWRAMHADQRLAALAALGLLLTMFFPWYGLQSVNRKTGVIYSHSISAFGDVSFVEAAIFLVAAGVAVMLLARAEAREFHLPGGDGTIVMVAGAWAALLIFFRVFSRPSTSSGLPVGIEWGFFLAFVAAGALTYAGWRMRAGERPPPSGTAPPRPRTPRTQAAAPPGRYPPAPGEPGRRPAAPAQPERNQPAPAKPRGYPPDSSEQLSFEDPATRPE